MPLRGDDSLVRSRTHGVGTWGITAWNVPIFRSAATLMSMSPARRFEAVFASMAEQSLRASVALSYWPIHLSTICPEVR